MNVDNYEGLNEGQRAKGWLGERKRERMRERKGKKVFYFENVSESDKKITLREN